jgi:purine nucleosidase
MGGMAIGEPRPLVLDVDTGIDDMVALLIAATAPELNLRGVTCVAGNVELQHVARNTGTLLHLVGRPDVPVSVGAARPLERPLRTAPDTHGPTGTGYARLTGAEAPLGDTDFTAVPAARYLAAHLDRHPSEVTIVALGPLTNLAAAVRNGLDFGAGAREVIWMGGTLRTRGNTTPTGEWNACVDPEAAEICFAAGAIDQLFPLDTTQQILFTDDDFANLPSSQLGTVVSDAVRFYIEYHRVADRVNGCYLHDAVTLVGALLRSDLLTDVESVRVSVDTSADPAKAGTLLPATDEGRRPVLVPALADPLLLKREILTRLGRAVANAPQGGF